VRISQIVSMGAVAVALGGVSAQAGHAFWSFDNWKSGDGVFVTAVTAHDLPRPPLLEAGGTVMLSTGGASEFTAFDNTIWRGSGSGSQPGHCLAWTSGSVNNVFSVTLVNVSGMATLKVRMDIRAYGFASGASFAGLAADTGSGFKPLPVALKPFPRPGEFGEWTVDLSGLDQLRDEKSVVLRWTVPDMPANGSLRVDNIQILAE
jgi:hypothetical protein